MATRRLDSVARLLRADRLLKGHRLVAACDALERIDPGRLSPRRLDEFLALVSRGATLAAADQRGLRCRILAFRPARSIVLKRFSASG